MDYPPFYRTRRGEIFFEKQVPDLIQALERIADQLPRRQSDAQRVIDELLLATYGLVTAANEVLDIETLPGSEATTRAFANLRERAEIARQAADVIR